MKDIIQNIQNKFKISEITKQKEYQYFITAEKNETVQLVTYLKDIEKFSNLILLSCADWIENGKFQLTYILNHPDKKLDIGVRTFIDRENASMESIHHLWKHAPTFQRELKEMYGIDFPGSPRVDEPFLLEGWDNIPPMRRDFDTKKYSEETYFPRPGRSTNDPAEYMKKKLYPNEKK